MSSLSFGETMVLILIAWIIVIVGMNVAKLVRGVLRRIFGNVEALRLTAADSSAIDCVTSCTVTL